MNNVISIGTTGQDVRQNIYTMLCFDLSIIFERQAVLEYYRLKLGKISSRDNIEKKNEICT